MQKTFYSKDYPNYLNYGALGSTVAHEFLHGFDLMGYRFDEDGKKS